MPISFQAESPVLGLVLPSNSPGVHTLWLPVIPMQIGLVLKPGPQEPWTPFRMAEAFFQAGIPREAISIYPGEGDVGAAVLEGCGRSLIFGGTPTVDRYRGNPRVQAHGPGFSKILLGDDQVDQWEKYLDVMVDSVFANSGRGCINCSGIWASRHGREIADAIAKRLAAVRPLPPDDPEASLAAFTVPGTADAISKAIDADLQAPGVTDVTAKHRDGAARRQGGRRARVPAADRRALRFAGRGDREEGIHVPVRHGGRLPARRRCSRRSGRRSSAARSPASPSSGASLVDAVHIDRLNLGPVPTIQLNWLQPHEGNIVEFLFRARAFQVGACLREAQDAEGSEANRGFGCPTLLSSLSHEPSALSLCESQQ